MHAKRFIMLILVISSSVMAERYAILAGNNFGGHGLETLRYVKNDIDNLSKALTSYCGFQQANIIQVYNRTPEDMEKTLRDISAKFTGPDSANLFLFYYTGHARAGNLLMGGKQYPLTSLKQQLNSLPSKVQVAVLDACQSGSITRSKGGSLAEPFLFKDEPDVEGKVVLYSSSESENSQESDSYKSSVFTFHFVNALRGLADASGDGRVTLSEAYQYSYNQTVASTVQSAGGVQHPGYTFDIRGEGNVVLADLRVRTCGITIAETLEGAFTILDKTGEVLAEFSKQTASAVFVALNPGRYDIIRRHKEKLTEASINIGPQSVQTVSEQHFTKTPPFRLTSKGAEATTPWFGVKLIAGAAFADLDNVSEQINNAYAAYGQFGTAPKISYWPAQPEFGSEVEARAGRMVILTCGVNYQLHTGHDRYSWMHTGPGSATAYPVRLYTRDTLRALTVYTGPGIRFNRGFLAGFFIKAGIEIKFCRFGLYSESTDALFDIEATASHHESGALAMPFGRIGYSRPVHRNIWICGDIGYRYQSHARNLNSIRGPVTYSEPTEYYYGYSYENFKFDFSGLDVRIGVMFTPF